MTYIITNVLLALFWSPPTPEVKSCSLSANSHFCTCCSIFHLVGAGQVPYIGLERAASCSSKYEWEPLDWTNRGENRSTKLRRTAWVHLCTPNKYTCWTIKDLRHGQMPYPKMLRKLKNNLCIRSVIRTCSKCKWFLPWSVLHSSTDFIKSVM